MLYCSYVGNDSSGKHGYCYFDPQISSARGQSRLYPTLDEFKKAIRKSYVPAPVIISDQKWYSPGVHTRALTKSELEFLAK